MPWPSQMPFKGIIEFSFQNESPDAAVDFVTESYGLHYSCDFAFVGVDVVVAVAIDVDLLNRSNM